ncbi:hypothetical protein EJB05_29025, partial [Eragrostis curvula]
MGLAAYLFFTPSGCGFLAYLNFDQLVKRGYVPFKDESCFSNGYLDTPVEWMDGMLPGARLRDLPTFIRTMNADDTKLSINIKQCELDAPAADGILLNTFDALERRAVEAVGACLPNTFTVGPLGAPDLPYLPGLMSILWRDDDRCTAWLDGHAEEGDASVVYVNFGSITVVTRGGGGGGGNEFAWGRAAAGCPFLWVIRLDMVRQCPNWPMGSVGDVTVDIGCEMLVVGLSISRICRLSV